MKRMMCLWLPNWPIQRVRNETRDRRPVVLFAKRSEASRLLAATGLRGSFTVTACSHGPARGGVRPGMPLGEAESLLAGMPTRFVRHDDNADRAGLRALAVACQRYTPLVALEEAALPSSLLLEITGSAHLFGGESSLIETVRAHLRELGWLARIAIADGVGAAWALAHAPRPPQNLIPPGRNRDIVPDLGVDVLRLPPKIVRLLQQFDLRQIRQVMRLPRADVASRFGQETLTRLDQALGTIPELVIPERHVEPVRATWQFEDPVDHLTIIENVLAQLIRQIVATAMPRHVGVQRLRCSLTTVDRTRTQFTLGLLHPTQSIERLLELLRLRLESVRLPAAVTLIETRALVAPLETRQPRWFESEDAPQRQAAFRDFVERVSNRLGDAAVVEPRLKPEAQPEFAWEYVPWLGQQGARLQGKAALQDPPALEDSPRRGLMYPIDLLPTPLSIHVETANEQPRRMAWRQRSYDIARFWGPQRIETGWWRGHDVHRDYYRVETSLGERFWLFRDQLRGAWFLHGIFA
ncbi:MAG: DNA polymerase Y family protein [Planctomycetota bacterium]|jgi:protein ImuB